MRIDRQDRSISGRGKHASWSEVPRFRGPDGRLYLTDPSRGAGVGGPITNSSVGQNYFRVVGPDGTDILKVPPDATGKCMITDFTLNGRIVESVLPGSVVVDRR
jgi:hypothetical protein